MRIPPLGIVVTLSAVTFACLSLSQLSAQSGDPPDQSAEALQMIVDYGQGKTKKRHSREGMMEPVGLPLNHTAAITLKFAGNKAGQSIALSALDGGEITIPAGNLLISANGSVLFNFRANGTPGLYRVLVELPTESHLLSFYVFVPPATP